MNSTDYDKLSKSLADYADSIQRAKRPGYTTGSADVLNNFKSVAARVGLTPEQAWSVYFLKHIDAISTFMCKPDLPVSEEPIGRFADAMNYLFLGYALYKERQNVKIAQANPPQPLFTPRPLAAEFIGRARGHDEDDGA